MALDPKDLRIMLDEDRPEKGIWPAVPHACWVTVTHLPTIIQARAYHGQQHKARGNAMAAVELLVDAAQLDGETPRFLERVAALNPPEGDT